MAIYKLGEVSSYVEGYVNPTINDPKYFNGQYHWMRVKDLMHGSTITNTELTLSQKGFNTRKNDSQIFLKGSIVWSKSGTVGNCALLGIDTCANRGILNILPKTNKVLLKYLYYFLIKNRYKFRRLATGAVLQHLYGPNLMKQKIELPDLEEQQKIIDIIEPVEKAINVSKTLINNISHLSDTLLKESEKTIKIEDIHVNEVRQTAFKSSNYESDGKYKVVTIKNVKDGHLNILKANKINTNDMSSVVLKNDVLVSLTGNCGRVAMVQQSEPMVLNQRVGGYRGKESFIIAANHQIIKRILNQYATGSAQKNTSLKYLSKIDFKIYDGMETLMTQKLSLTLMVDELIELKSKLIRILVK